MCGAEMNLRDKLEGAIIVLLFSVAGLAFGYFVVAPLFDLLLN